MPVTRSTNLNLRIAPNVREALRLAAEKERRSISNMIEYLICQHCERCGIPLPPEKSESYHQEDIS